MSALLIDDLLADDCRIVAQSKPADVAPALAEVRTLPVRGSRIAAPTRAASDTSVWRLTDRGIAVVGALLVGLFLAGVVVVVASFLSISDAPLADSGADAASVSVLR
ncbi:MAG: hypothetical protein K4304_09595 [Propionicimonas sp.]